MTNKMLVDTSGFFSLYDEADEFHRQAVSFYDAAAKRLTTNYVLAEYTALAQVRGVPRSEIIKFSNRILDDKDVEIIWIDENLHPEPSRFCGKEPTKIIRCAMPPVSS